MSKRNVRGAKKRYSAPRRNVAPNELSPAPQLVPASPPLEGEALECKVAEVLCRGFRETRGRVALRDACHGADESKIETAIVSPRVQCIVEPVMRAFTLEETVAIISLLLRCARAALEAEKPTPAQVTALKIVFETLVEKLLVRIGGDVWKESVGEIDLSDYEKSLVENLLQLVRGQRKPVAAATQIDMVPEGNERNTEEGNDRDHF